MFRFFREKNIPPRVIAGLGNPGGEYCRNRHNVGFMAIDYLADAFNVAFKAKFQALVGQAATDRGNLLLLKPQTYMNLSGRSVREALNWYKIKAQDLIVIYDDMDIPFGILINI